MSNNQQNNMQQPTNLTQRSLIYCFIGALLCILFSCQGYDNNGAASPGYALIEKYPVDTAKEHFLFNLGAKLLDGIIYDIQEDADHTENQKVIDRLLDSITMPDSLLVYKFISVRTKKDHELINSWGSPLSAQGEHTTYSNIKYLQKNGLHLEFWKYFVCYSKIVPVSRNGVNYSKGIVFYIHTNNNASDRQVWIRVDVLQK
jgi:hypothetical protein